MNMLISIRLKAISIGFLVFIILHFLNRLIVTVLISSNINPASFSVLYGYISFFICGYLTGFISKKAGFLNGAIVGILTPLVSITSLSWAQFDPFKMFSDIFNLGLFWLFIGLFCCGFGGFIWDLHAKIIKEASNLPTSADPKGRAAE